MISAFGVDHGEISKAAWKSFYPVPPGVGKIPRGQLKIIETDKGATRVLSASLKARPHKEIGNLTVGAKKAAKPNPTFGPPQPAKPAYIAHVGTKSQYTRRGVASNLLREARKTETVVHSPVRTSSGDAFARATKEADGSAPVASKWSGHTRSKGKVSKGGSIAPLARRMTSKPLINRVVGNPMKPGKLQRVRNAVGAHTTMHTTKYMGAIEDKLGANPFLAKRRDG